MFDVLFGWRKASKCKKVIKLAQCRLKLLKNKKHVIVKQLRQDTAHLINTGYPNIALNRAEQLVQDENIMAAYDLLDRFCEFILKNFSYIRRRNDFPNDINEAVSSLIYASARCGELPELRVIRKLFEDRYGPKFVVAAVDLLPGNLVNSQVMETLATESVSNGMKHKTVNEIAEDYCLKKPEVLALEYYPEWQQEPVKESCEHNVLPKDVPTSDAEIEAQIILVDSSSTRTNLSTEPSSTSASDISSIIQQDLPIVSQSTLHKKAQNIENSIEEDSQRIYSLSAEESKGIITKADAPEDETSFESKEERSLRGSSSESLPQFCEMVVYLDDIEEYQSPTAKDEDSQDQRFFKFNSSMVSKKVNFRNSGDQSYWERHESGTERSSTKGPKRSHIVSRKRSRRRLVYQENQSVKDVEYAGYYDRPHKSTSNHKHRPRHQRLSYDAQRRQNQFCSEKIEIIPFTSNRRYYANRPCCRCCCNHEMPCYFSTDEENKDCGVPPRKQKNLVTRHSGDQMFRVGESNSEMKQAAMPPKPRRKSCDNGVIVYDVLTYPDPQIHKQNNGLKAVPVELVLQGGHPSLGSCRTRKDTEVPPYSRTATMPPERSKDSSKDDFQRSNSCPVQYPNHVHPKLPDYDDLTARFMALKKENMLNKLHCSKQ